MGISGLLPLLKSIQQQKHLSDLCGKTLAVDAYVWLHKGAYGCAVELVTGKPTTKYVDYAMHRIRLMRHHGIEPYIVFDGGHLPAKQATDVERRKRREESLEKAKQLASQGRHAEARELYVKCVDISPRHAYQLIKALRAESVRYVVAPYEADAQLAFLERAGIVDGVLTEDSDLLVFGCQNVYFKLDASTYTLTHISRSRFSQVTDINLSFWTDKEFRHMAMLSGCDYLEGLKGVGIRTANKLLRKYKTLERTIKFIALESGGVKVPKGYMETFLLAELAFLFQRVYDPLTQRLVHLGGQPPSDWTDAQDRYVGLDISEDVAQSIAVGDLCPVSREPIKDINPGFKPGERKSTSSAATAPSKAAIKSGPMDRFIISKSARASTIKVKPPISKPGLPGSSGPACKTDKSGRRSLSGEMEKLQESKRRAKAEATATTSTTKASNLASRFFGASPADQAVSLEPAGDRADPRADDSEEAVQETDAGNVSAGTLVVQTDEEECLELELELDEVEQEEGYRSLSPTFGDIRASSPDFISSPDCRKRGDGTAKKRASSGSLDEDDWGDVDDVFSSPIRARTVVKKPVESTRSSPKSGDVTLPLDGPIFSTASTSRKQRSILLVRDTPSPTKPDDVPAKQGILSVDLGALFESFERSGNGQAGPSGVLDRDQNLTRTSTTAFTEETQPSSLGDSAPESDFDAVAESDLEGGETEADEWEMEQVRKLQKVAQGWRARFSLDSPRRAVERKLIRRETTLSPIAQRRRGQPSLPNKTSLGKGTEPLKLSELDLERLSISPSPVEKRTEPQHHPPRKSGSRPFKRHGLSDDSDEPREESERWYKRRRISFPAKEEYTDGLVEQTPVSRIAVSRIAHAGATSETATESRSRLDKFRFGS